MNSYLYAVPFVVLALFVLERVFPLRTPKARLANRIVVNVLLFDLSFYYWHRANHSVAIRGFTDSLRSELLHADSHVRLTTVHLPALNTPQFSWCKTRMPRHPQPVPPVFQPEVAADAIVWAADHPSREVNVDFPTVKAIGANKILPDFLDRYLAWTGYDAQQTNEPGLILLALAARS